MNSTGGGRLSWSRYSGEKPDERDDVSVEAREGCGLDAPFRLRAMAWKTKKGFCMIADEAWACDAGLDARVSLSFSV